MTYNKKGFIGLINSILYSRILIVDDNKANLLVLNAILKPKGYHVDKAISGDEALKLCLKNDYDLFILDVQMPNMNGFELAENLKSINRTKEIPIIFLTAISKNDKFSIKGYKIGAIDYLTKPINDELLLLKVDLFLELYHQKKHIKSLNNDLDKKVEERTKLLNLKSEFLGGILTSIKNQIALIDDEGNIVLTNKAWDKFSKKNPIDAIFRGAIGENYFNKIKKENNDPIFLLVSEAYRRVLNGLENNFQMEYQCKLTTDIRWFFIDLTPYGDKNGIVISIADITNRKNIEESIRLNESKLKDIVNNISDAIFSVDNDFIITSWNRSCENIYGYTEKEALNKKMDELLKTEFIHFSNKEITNKLKDKKGWSGEIIQLNKIGKPLFVNANYKIIYNNKKDNIGITILNKDITRVRKNEIELTNALILGEETERKRIASNLHDGLGQYLSGLRMQLQVIKEDVEEEYYTNLISLVDTAIKEYRSVSHNIIPPNLTQDGFVEAVKLTCSKLNSDTVKFTIKSNLEHIKITSEIEMELYRITQELINNALKHANAQKIDITFNINESKMLSIKIIDNGDGFDVEKNVNNTKTGIGLKNILSRIHFLKGTINITSKIGIGSQFIIKIKL